MSGTSGGCLPDPCRNTAADVALLPKVLDAASRYGSRPPDEAMEQLLSRRELVPLFS